MMNDEFEYFWPYDWISHGNPTVLMIFERKQAINWTTLCGVEV